MSMKKSNDTIGNWTHDLPACSAVPQPTAPPAACPKLRSVRYNFYISQSVHSFSPLIFDPCVIQLTSSHEKGRPAGCTHRLKILTSHRPRNGSEKPATTFGELNTNRRKNWGFWHPIFSWNLFTGRTYLRSIQKWRIANFCIILVPPCNWTHFPAQSVFSLTNGP